MSASDFLPRVLVIDDLLGRRLADQRNDQRSNFCGQYMIKDVTDDESVRGEPKKFKAPVAEAVFCRAQTPVCSTVGDTIENDLQGTLKVIREGWEQVSANRPRWALVLLDLCFYTGRVTEQSHRETPGMPEGRDSDDVRGSYFGLKLLRAIHDEFPELPIIVLSAQPRDEVSREFTLLGARGFLAKDAGNGPAILKDYLQRYGLIPDADGDLVGCSKPLLLCLRAARVAALNRLNILIRGERGVGKELLARYIHRQSSNGGTAPLVEVNSAVLTPELFASELFGHEKGAFTGADQRRIGKVWHSNGGDLFLDEIKDLLPQVQAGVLKVLEERAFTPVGGTTQNPVDVRFLSATNADIEALAAADRFRPDLLDRLRQGGTIVLPPLREHKEDIPLLVEKFVRDAEQVHSRALPREIDAKAMEKLCSYDWPGNIRELRDCIFNAVNNHPDVEHLVSIHLQLGGSDRPQLIDPEVLPAASQSRIPESLDALVGALAEFTFDSLRQRELAGRLPLLQEAYAQFVARYLKAALESTGETSRGADGNWQTEIFISRAMKLVTGDGQLTTTRAADLLKRLLALFPNANQPLLDDPILKQARETALNLRPKKQNARKSDSPE